MRHILIYDDCFQILDPDPNNCNAECGDPNSLATLDIQRHVLCRRQCILPDFTGIARFRMVIINTLTITLLFLGRRLAPTCSKSSSYFSSLDECVPLSIYKSPQFLSATHQSRVCSGSQVTSPSQLEQLRYCTNIQGALNITVSSASADYSSLYDIEAVQGLFDIS